MEKKRKMHRDKIFKRFALTFLVVLCFPVMCFILIFIGNYREIYLKKIVEQAEYSLQASGSELERNLESLETIGYYNMMNSRIKKIVLKKNYCSTEMKELLSSEKATHSVLENIYYYNGITPDTVYTNSGTYNISYYARYCVGMEEEEFLEMLKNLKIKGWLCFEKDAQNGENGKKYIQFMTRSGSGEWWIFQLSDQSLKEILEMEHSVTLLQDEEGNLLYETGWEENREYSYKISFDSPKGYFRLVRHIDTKSLFIELNEWQNFFFLMVILILVVGGSLVLILTQYNEKPIKKMLNFTREKVKDIPKDMDGMEVFWYAMKSMEEQVLIAEKKDRINQLLMHLIYEKNCNTLYLQNNMKEMSIFQNAECYRAILIVSGNRQEIDMNKVVIYLKNFDRSEYEFRMIDIPNKAAIVLIVGMSEVMEKNLKEVLLKIADDIRESVNEEICFFVGGKCKELKKIHSSYMQALICRQNGSEKDRGQVIFYKAARKNNKKTPYPKEELNQLYAALTAIDLKKASAVTDKLIGVMRDYRNQRFVSVSLYYDILNTFYRAFMLLEMDMESEFLEADILEVKDNSDAVQMILSVLEQFGAFVKETSEKSDKRLSEESADKRDLISDVCSFVDANSRSSDLSVSMVADHFEMTVSHLSHKFKEQKNCNISDYITEKKFAYARKMLLETDYSVKEISFKIGYSHPVSFIRKFKQLYGVTPAEYRGANMI